MPSRVAAATPPSQLACHLFRSVVSSHSICKSGQFQLFRTSQRRPCCRCRYRHWNSRLRFRQPFAILCHGQADSPGAIWVYWHQLPVTHNLKRTHRPEIARDAQFPSETGEWSTLQSLHDASSCRRRGDLGGNLLRFRTFPASTILQRLHNASTSIVVVAGTTLAPPAEPSTSRRSSPLQSSPVAAI